jgi:Kef-type K+ transport system membrane component KefB
MSSRGLRPAGYSLALRTIFRYTGSMRTRRTFGAYGLAALALLQHASAHAQAAAAQPAASGGVDHSAFFHVLLGLAVILLAARIAGWAFTRIGQPSVSGEMFAGIALGPSILGRVAPELSGYLFPSSTFPQLSVIAQVGVVLYLFVIGLELDPRGVRQRARSAIVVSFAGIAVPLALGASVASLLHPVLAPPGVSQLAFAAFFSIALAVTAFPVLARIVEERKLEKHPLGIMALTCAAAGDLAAWCMLSIVVGLVRVQANGLRTLGYAALYLAIMFGVVRPLLAKLVAREERAGELSRASMSSLFVLVLASALATEWIGVHALFGAFLVGALIPPSSALAQRVLAKLEDVVCVLLLPLFFAITGLRMQVGSLDGMQGWLLCALIILVAFLGKLGGTSLAARMVGMDWRTSVQLGALMNTRGLMELIVLNVGLDLGIISSELFGMMVIMALITTLAAAPLLNWMGREDARASLRPPASDENAPLAHGS